MKKKQFIERWQPYCETEAFMTNGKSQFTNELDELLKKTINDYIDSQVQPKFSMVDLVKNIKRQDNET